MAQVFSFELAIFASQSSRGDQNLVPATSPTNSKQFEFLGQVPATQNASCGLFVGPVPSCKLFRRLVAGTLPLMCADLKGRIERKFDERTQY